MRAAVNAAVRANVAIYPVDSRGLQAIVPGGSARQGSRGGVAAFSGRGVAQQFTQLAAQQETLTTLASDTGGTAFTDTNDFGEAFTKVVKDISSYYILGFASTQHQQGRPVPPHQRSAQEHGPASKVEAREGYYADRDFTHTAKTRSRSPAAGTAADADSGDRRAAVRHRRMVPAGGGQVLRAGLARRAGLRRAARRRTRSRSTSPASSATSAASRSGRIRDTLTVPPASADGLAARQVLYQTGVTLPPGRFSVKIVVRENTTGQMGTFETPIVVPELKNAPVKVSSLVLEHAAAERGRAQDRQPARARRRRARAQPHAHREPRSEAVFLLRGVRAGGGERRRRSCEPTSRSTAARSRYSRRRSSSGRRSMRRIGARQSSSSRCRPRASSPASTPARSTSSTRWRAASSFPGSSSTCVNPRAGPGLSFTAASGLKNMELLRRFVPITTGTRQKGTLEDWNQ